MSLRPLSFRSLSVGRHGPKCERDRRRGAVRRRESSSTLTGSGGGLVFAAGVKGTPSLRLLPVGGGPPRETTAASRALPSPNQRLSKKPAQQGRLFGRSTYCGRAEAQRHGDNNPAAEGALQAAGFSQSLSLGRMAGQSVDAPAGFLIDLTARDFVRNRGSNGHPGDETARAVHDRCRRKSRRREPVGLGCWLDLAS